LFEQILLSVLLFVSFREIEVKHPYVFCGFIINNFRSHIIKIQIMKRFIAGFFAVAMILSAVAVSTPTVNAQTMTSAEIMAAIANLQAQLSAMTGTPSAGTPAMGTAVTFNTDLTIGSKGADVTALQQALVARGYLQMPTNTSYGYFGPLTRTAVAAWQSATGISPAAGYFGPVSRTALNRAVGTPVTGTTPGATVVCPVGFTCTSTGTGTTVGGITTPGVEGTLSVTSAPVSTGTIYEGDSMVTGLAFRARAQRSDIAIQRVTVDLGNSTAVYNKVFNKIYVTDASGSVLASADLNSNTVVKNGSRYEITLSGFSYVVSRDSSKDLMIKFDVRNSIDAADITAGATIALAGTNQAVRGVDGAGIDQYSGGNTISKSLTLSKTLTDSASLTLTTNTNNPLTQEVVAADGSANNEIDGVTLLSFDIKAEKDNLLLTDLVATTTVTGGSATVSTVYLFAGNSRIASASVSGGVATFSDIDYSISKDSTKTFSIQVDVRNAGSAQTTISASVQAANVTAENSIGDTLAVGFKSGVATGNSILVRNTGAVFSLVGTPTITKSATAQSNNTSTSTVTATFQLRMKAVGGAITFGNNASTSRLVTNTVAAAPSFVIYKGGAVVAASLVGASTTSFTLPSQGILNNTPSANTVTLQEDQEITVPVSFTFEGRTADGANVLIGTYAVGLANINYTNAAGAPQTSSFMAGQTNWRTSEVTLP
jgi:hypothetical protein